ncbi:Hypothetical protein PBC10988_30000 [Planctomycetales bacterium 10988]|nr:Hypothetical protein PBC10988_30000 [Planctomycetales bacterium 10988]
MLEPTTSHSLATPRSQPIKHRPEQLPDRLRILLITNRQRLGAEFIEQLQADPQLEVLMEEVQGTNAAMRRLREEAFDLLLVAHDYEQVDALEFVESLRVAGAYVPVLIVGAETEQECLEECCFAGAEGYLSIHTTSPGMLFWKVAQALERRQLLEENQRHHGDLKQRGQKEQEEVRRLFNQQRELALASVDDPNCPLSDCLETLLGIYRDLLRTHLLMGSGNLTQEIRKLAAWLAASKVETGQALILHLTALQQLVKGLGSRSSRHMVARADLLAMQLLIELSEAYRSQQPQVSPPLKQGWLPGFEPSLEVPGSGENTTRLAS